MLMSLRHSMSSSVVKSDSTVHFPSCVDFASSAWSHGGCGCCCGPLIPIRDLKKSAIPCRTCVGSVVIWLVSGSTMAPISPSLLSSRTCFALSSESVVCLFVDSLWSILSFVCHDCCEYCVVRCFERHSFCAGVDCSCVLFGPNVDPV